MDELQEIGSFLRNKSIHKHVGYNNFILQTFSDKASQSVWLVSAKLSKIKFKYQILPRC